MKIVSACLIGINCRWDGQSRLCEKVTNLVKQGEAIPVCPEQLGGLSTPRHPAKQKGNKVITKYEEDVTSYFRRGAEETLKIAKLVDCQYAILKSKSPSCGIGLIYNGTFSRKLIKGDGVTAKLLKQNNIKVMTENDL